MKSIGAYITVHITLCIMLILSLFLVVIDGARKNGVRLETMCVMDVGLTSIMAEYHRGLQERYNLFAIDSSYGSSLCGRKVTEAHLMDYLRKNVSKAHTFFADYRYRDLFQIQIDDAELTRVSIITDGDGAVFRNRAIEAVKDEFGLSLFAKLQGWMQTIEINGLDSADINTEQQSLSRELEQLNGREVQLSEDEFITVRIDHPMDCLERKKQEGILRLVVEDEQGLSNASLEGEVLLGNRKEQGRINLGDMEYNSADGLTDRLWFQEYVLKYLGNYRNEKESSAIVYQIEYLISGEEQDRKNLQKVTEKIFALREAANVVYLMSDNGKRAQIAAAASILGSMIPVPGTIPLLESIILIGWASAESIYDTKTLLSGSKIPLIKDYDSWHYSLEEALRGETDAKGEGREGLSYEDYLRVLLMMTPLDDMTVRAMNIVEADIRKMPCNSRFRLDACFSAVEATVTVKSNYGYRFEGTRTATY